MEARQRRRLAQRLHLVRAEADAGAERRLEQVRIGGGGAVRAQGWRNAAKRWRG